MVNQHPEYQYLNLLDKILKEGSDKPVFGVEDTYIRSTFGEKMEFDLSQGFPLLTTKKVFLKAIIVELLWLLQGSSNIKYLVDNSVHIWDEWAYKKYLENVLEADQHALEHSASGLDTPSVRLSLEEYIKRVKEDPEFAKYNADLGPAYPVNWRHFSGPGATHEADQIKWVIEGLKKRPERKSYVVSAWNPLYTYEMAPSREQAMALPPCHTTFQFCVNDGKLNCALFQRSGDMFLGIPFNIASYSLLTQ